MNCTELVWSAICSVYLGCAITLSNVNSHLVAVSIFLIDAIGAYMAGL